MQLNISCHISYIVTPVDFRSFSRQSGHLNFGFLPFLIPSGSPRITFCAVLSRGPGSSVGIATGYGAGRSGDRIPVGARFFATVQTGSGAHPASCTMGTESFLGVKSGRGVTLTPHLLLVPWSRKSRAIPLLSLWAVRPVQSHSACTRVHFTFLSQFVPDGQPILVYLRSLS